ncbi:FHA domain-containing protein [Halobacteriovorax marinus]|nr:FHA domain-containing protein [Halobacteriovorax marinus]
MAVLLIIREENEERRVKLTAQPLILGRSSKCHVQIKDQMCSGKHCAFKLNQQFKVLVKDLESTNGTYLNDCQIMDTHLMLDDVLKIGNCEIFIDRSELSPKEKAILTRDEPTAQIKFMDLPSSQRTVKPSQVVRAKQQAQQGAKPGSKPVPKAPKKFFPESEEKTMVAKKPVPKQEPVKKPQAPEGTNTNTNTSLKERLAQKAKNLNQKKSAPQVEVSNERQIDLEESSGDTQFIQLDKGDKSSPGDKKKKSSLASKLKKVFKK